MEALKKDSRPFGQTGRGRISKSSVVLCLWTVFFFTLFSAVPSLEAHSGVHFFLTLLKCLLLWSILVPCGMAAGAWLRRTGMLQAKHRIRPAAAGWLAFAILCVCWGIALAALYPGTFGADAPIQLLEFDGTHQLRTHHPLLHTWLVGIFLHAGRALSGNANTGVFLYTLFQVLFCAAAAAWSIRFLAARKVPAWLWMAGILYLGLNPYMAMLVCYSTKDVPFGAAFVFFIVSCCGFWTGKRTNQEQRRPDWKAAAAQSMPVVFWGVILCLLRNQGIYIVLLAAAGWVLWGWKKRSRPGFWTWPALQVVIAVLFLILNSVFASLSGAVPGSAREIFSVPIQQVAAALKKTESGEKEIYTPGQAELARSLFLDYTSDDFDPRSVDPAKDELDEKKVRENPRDFLALWKRAVLADFPGAVYAWSDLMAPYFDMTLSSYYTGLSVQYSYGFLLEDNPLWQDIEQQSLLPQLKQKIYEMSVPARQKTTFWGWSVFQMQVVLYVMMFAFLKGCIEKKRMLFGSGLLGLLYFLTLLAGPGALARYLFPLVLLMPLWTGLCAISSSTRKIH